MENQVSQQLLVFLRSIVLGLSVGLLYDLLRPFRLRSPRCTGLLDALYCLAAGAAVFRFVLGQARGEARGFYLLGSLGGAVLFFSGLSAPLRPVWTFWADTLAWMAQLLSFPLRWLKNFCKKPSATEKTSFIF